MTRALPTGMVTFLFTDVEGSTRLLYELGAQRYAEALTQHRRLLRDAFLHPCKHPAFREPFTLR